MMEWARENGVSRQSAASWFRAGVLAVPAHQLATGTILVDKPAQALSGVAIYARVSSGEQRADLDRQVARITMQATADGLAHQAYPFELDPNNHVRFPLASHAGAARFAYNWSWPPSLSAPSARRALGALALRQGAKATEAEAWVTEPVGPVPWSLPALRREWYQAKTEVVKQLYIERCRRKCAPFSK